MVFDLDDPCKSEDSVDTVPASVEPLRGSIAKIETGEVKNDSVAMGTAGLVSSQSVDARSGSGSLRLEQLKKQHEQQRLEMKKMIQMQKRRMLDGHNALIYGGNAEGSLAADEVLVPASKPKTSHDANATYSDLVVQDFVYVATPTKATPHVASEEDSAEDHSSPVQENLALEADERVQRESKNVKDDLREKDGDFNDETQTLQADECSEPVNDSLEGICGASEGDGLGQSFIAELSEQPQDIIIDDTTALEYSMMLNQMQSILALPSVHKGAAPGLSPVTEGAIEDDDEFEDPIDDSDADIDAASPEDIPISENYSDDDEEEPQAPNLNAEEGVLGAIQDPSTASLSDSDYAQTLFAELADGNLPSQVDDSTSQDHISPFSEGEATHTGAEDIFSITATMPTPHVMNIVTTQNENSFFKLSNESLNNERLDSTAQIQEELLLRITHLRGYLTNQLGLEKFSRAMYFLTALPQKDNATGPSLSNDKTLASAAAEEDDEQLLNDLEGIIGEEGLHLMDDLFQLITLENRLVE